MHAKAALLKSPRPRRPEAPGGFAAVIALILLAVGVCIAVVAVTSGTLSIRQATSLHRVGDAQLAAESGLRYMLAHLKAIHLPGDTTEATFLANAIDALRPRLEGTANLGAQTLSNSSSQVAVPEMQVGDGQSFRSWITWVGPDRCRLTVRGSAGGLTRYLTMDLALVRDLPFVFDYGLATRGQVQLSGQAKIIGINKPEEASVFSGTMSVPTPIHIQGSSVAVDGDLYVAQSVGSVVVEGSPQIGGTSDPMRLIEHIHFDVEVPDFPVLQTDHLVLLATNVVDGSTDTSQAGQVFENIRIAAGTNPTFASNVVINGMVYVEAPNIVSFEGHCTINGMIVTQPSENPISDCQIQFAGTVDAVGVDGLDPNNPAYDEVRKYTGSFLLAPGFGVSFAGDFQTINGTIAADQLTFGGTATGVIKGTVIGLADLPTVLDGNVSVKVDRSHLNQNPAGIIKPFAFDPLPDSYLEPIGP